MPFVKCGNSAVRRSIVREVKPKPVLWFWIMSFQGFQKKSQGAESIENRDDDSERCTEHTISFWSLLGFSKLSLNPDVNVEIDYGCLYAQ